MMDDTKILDIVLDRLKRHAEDEMPISPKRAALLIEQIGTYRGQRTVSYAPPDRLAVTAAEFPEGTRVKHAWAGAGYGTVSGYPYHSGISTSICVPVQWDDRTKTDTGWFAHLMERVPSECYYAQEFWRCKHHPSAINNWYDGETACGYGCEKSELRWFDNGCKQATS